MTVHAIVLAAGRGTRMRSDMAKVLHELEGRPLVLWALDAIEGLATPTVVVGHQAAAVGRVLDAGIRTVLQEPQHGTGHAVEVALADLRPSNGDVVLVVPSDMPLLRRRTIVSMLDSHAQRRNAVTVLSVTVENPAGYGRIVRGPRGLLAIVEHADASTEQLAIREVNTSVYAFDATVLAEALSKLGRSNAQNEKYLTDTIGLVVETGARVGTVTVDPGEAAGVNNQAELADASRRLRNLGDGELPGYAARRQRRADPGAVLIEIASRKRLMVFSGSSNEGLAREVANILGAKLGGVERSVFANGEIYIRYTESVRGNDCFVVQSHSGPVNFHVVEQLVMIDALKRASAKRITAVVPFFAYARQDKKGLPREPITARLMGDLFVAAGADRIVSVDLHTGQIQGFVDMPFDHLTALPVFVDYLQTSRRWPDHRRFAGHRARARGGPVRQAARHPGRLRPQTTRGRRPQRRRRTRDSGRRRRPSLHHRRRHDRYRRHRRRRRETAHGARGSRGSVGCHSRRAFRSGRSTGSRTLRFSRL